MRTAPTNWTTLMAQPHVTETRVDIDDVSYYGYDGSEGIWSLSTRNALFENFSAGNCHAGQIDLVLVNPQDIPTMAQMEVYVRLTNGTLTTDWVRKGVYFIDTREWDAQHEFLTITGYDAMLKAEQPYFKPPVTIVGWPKVDTDVVDEICERIGVDLDSRTVLDKEYMVQLPAASTDGSGSDSIRTTLGYIAAAYGGNWIITDDGELMLVPLKSSASAIALGTSGVDLQTFPAYDALGTVRVVVSEDAEYVAGTLGRSIEVSCPWGTQEMANNLLTALAGYVYQPLTITTEYAADPLFELGDKITFNGFTSVIADETINFSLAYTADFSAPNGEELNHEYPYQDKGTQEIKREIAKTTASLRVDIDGIKAMVSGLAEAWESGKEYAIGEIVEYENKFYRCIEENSDDAFDPDKWMEIDNGVVESILQLGIGKMTLSVSGSGAGSTITLTSGSVEIASAAAYFETNEAHFSGTLSGEKITAGSSISAPKIYAEAGAQGGYVQMTDRGFDLYTPGGVLKAQIGYTSGQYDYPYMQLGAGSDIANTKGLIKKFGNGLWIGNNVVEDGSGVFVPREGCYGIFCDFQAGEVFIVDNTEEIGIFIGQTVARFG